VSSRVANASPCTGQRGSALVEQVLLLALFAVVAGVALASIGSAFISAYSGRDAAVQSLWESPVPSQ